MSQEATNQFTIQKKLTRSHAVDEDKQLIDFLRDTMLRSVKDRNIILRIETDLIQFLSGGGGTHLPFPSMSSYHRMLVHRIASLFNLDHNIDQIHNCVVVSKNGKEKLPDFRFRELLENNTEEVRVLPRKEQRNEVKVNVLSHKSFEERELEYNKARSRIFMEKSESFGGFGAGGVKSQISPASSGYRSLGQGWGSLESGEELELGSMGSQMSHGQQLQQLSSQPQWVHNPTQPTQQGLLPPPPQLYYPPPPPPPPPFYYYPPPQIVYVPVDYQYYYYPNAPPRRYNNKKFIRQ